MSDTTRAALWMIGAIVSFSSMAVAGRELSGVLDTFEIMTYRSFVGIAIVFGYITFRGLWDTIGRDHLGLHAARNVAHFTGQNLWFFAITAAPLAQVVALEFTTPLWILLLAPIVLGERLTSIRALSAVLGFIGILIVARPTPETINVGLVAAAGSAVGFAISIMLTKKLTRTENILTILVYLTAMQAVFGLVCAGFDGDMAVPGLSEIPWVILVGIAGLSAHYCLTTALSLAPATVVVPVDFARLPTIAFVGMLLYGEPLDIWVFLGAVVIFAGNYLNIWWETRRAPAT